MIKKTTDDFTKATVASVNLQQKIEPINKAIENMLTRLEEFETLVSFVQPDVQDSRDILSSTSEYRSDLDDLCNKIDTVEFLIAHIKNNLDTLEESIEKAEKKYGVSDGPVTSVTSIFTPFFKKSIEKKSNISEVSPGASPVEIFKTEDYFK